MAGKRNQAVLHKYLMAASERVAVKGFELAQRLLVPEPFSQATHADAAGRRRAKLSLLTPAEGRRPLARAWLRVIWRAWIDRKTYHPAQHRAARSMLNAPAG